MAPTTEISIRRTIRRQQLREMVPLADSTIYEMEQRGISRDASLFHRAAWFGTSRKSKPGWPRADQPQSHARNLLTSGNGNRALFESRVGF